MNFSLVFSFTLALNTGNSHSSVFSEPSIPRCFLQCSPSVITVPLGLQTFFLTFYISGQFRHKNDKRFIHP